MVSVLMKRGEHHRSIERFYARASETPFDRAFSCTPRAAALVLRRAVNERHTYCRVLWPEVAHPSAAATLPNGLRRGVPGWPHDQQQHHRPENRAGCQAWREGRRAGRALPGGRSSPGMRRSADAASQTRQLTWHPRVLTGSSLSASVLPVEVAPLATRR